MTGDDITLAILEMDRHYDRLALLLHAGELSDSRYLSLCSALRTFQDAAAARTRGEITSEEFEAAQANATEVFAQ